ncbi:MAG: hypothetical protein ACI8RP_000951 [Urechidicola sp.]|jgi:hypothetical protein
MANSAKITFTCLTFADIPLISPKEIATHFLPDRIQKGISIFE